MVRPALGASWPTRATVLTVATLLASTAVPARAEPAPASDAAFLDALTWGVTPASHAELRAKGRERWLREQLHPLAALRLPAAAQAQVDALTPKGTLLERISAFDAQARSANAEPDPEARKARTVVANVETLVAGEILMACQALSLVADVARDHPLGSGTRAALDAVRKVIAPALSGDRWYQAEMEAALALVRSGAVVAAVEAAIGPLE